MSYTFRLVPPPANTSQQQLNVTAVKVDIADLQPRRRRGGQQHDIQDKTEDSFDYIFADSVQFEESMTATALCGQTCSARSCSCFTKMVRSQACYIDRYVSIIIQ